MASDRALGGGILGGSVLGILVYGVLLAYFPTVILEVTAFLAVAALLGILAWIGWTMATTPPPEPMPDVGAAQPSQSPGIQSKPEGSKS